MLGSLRSAFRPTQWLVLGLMLFSLLASAHISRAVLERLPRLEDEYAYLYQAKIFAHFQAYVVRDEPVKVFWQPFVLQPEAADSYDGVTRRFGKYTPGYPMVLAVGVILGQPWLINAVLGMLNVGLIYRLGRAVFARTGQGEAIGVIAAALLAISPTALILNATLMSHTWALLAALLFVYAYLMAVRRLTNERTARRWAILCGVMLGALFITRPLTAVMIGAPVGLHALTLLLRKDQHRHTLSRLLVTAAIAALPVMSLWGLCNLVWTGSPFTNTYTLQWPYDKVGFGVGHGLNRGGHSLHWAWRNARADLTFWIRDTFGFTLMPEANDFLKSNWGYQAGVGIAWLFVLMGLLYGRKVPQVWWMFSFFAAIVIGGLFYWIGSAVHGGAVYSVRYYYEAIFGACLVAAYGFVALAADLGKHGTKIVYTGVAMACVASVVGYTPARLREPLPGEWSNGLYGFNRTSQAQLARIEAMREAYATSVDQKVLLVILRTESSGPDNWRDYGAALAQTSPFLDSDIVVARVFDPKESPEIERRFFDRLVLYQIGAQLYPTLEDALNSSTQ